MKQKTSNRSVIIKIPRPKKLPIVNYKAFQKDLENLINKHCCENGSNTPDFILTEYLVNCLKTFDACSRAREKWFGKRLKI